MRYIKSLLFGTLLCTISILSSNGYAMNNNNSKKFGVGCYFNVDSFYNIMKERGKEYIPNQFCESSEENTENYLIQSNDNSNDNKVENKEDINKYNEVVKEIKHSNGEESEDKKEESDAQFVRRINNCIKNKHDPDTVDYKSFYPWFSDYKSFSAEDLTRLYKLLDGISYYTSSNKSFSVEDLTRFCKLLNDNKLPILSAKCDAILKVWRKQSQYLFSVDYEIHQHVRYAYNLVSNIMPLTDKQLQELEIRVTNNKKYVEKYFSHINKLFYPPQIFDHLIRYLKYENTLITEEKEQIQRELKLTKNQYNNLLEEQRENMIIVNEKLREANNKSSEYKQTISKLTNELQDKTIIIEELKKQIEQLKNSNSNNYL